MQDEEEGPEPDESVQAHVAEDTATVCNSCLVLFLGGPLLVDHLKHSVGYDTVQQCLEVGGGGRRWEKVGAGWGIRGKGESLQYYTTWPQTPDSARHISP